ncbi:trifunctional nucleotide phosphoesterase protein YfkN [Colletotrichum spaethianum]|uniref:Trifunctional nucleotide phosphoesterase protein YfkN n=1 Tax=Colletotrichum spaethianum TaxID=700344 RepID=A0AA37LCX3_9PEZI|nr:trifunctional nucleotide phosphoesterase protein YfkN [Colletotrichum spaethianum]GKT46051.1 trifunctional nucleotide phosphoesterase protein YfkN [Colletotrichum spaethianum]
MWLMGSSIGFLLVGRLSDLFGRRWFIVGSSFLGAVGSIIGCFGSNTTVLVAASICNSVAAAAQLSFGFVIGELVPTRLRAPWFVATLLGPFVTAPISAAVPSYVLLDGTSRRRWNCGVGFGCAFVSTWVYFLCYFPPSCKQLNVGGGTKLQMAKTVDIVGILLFVSGCVLTMLGFSWVGAEYQWRSKEVRGTIIGGFASYFLFFIYALMPPKLFKNRYYFALATNALFASMTYFILYVSWPIVVAKVFGGNSYYISWQIGMLGILFLIGMAIAGISIANGTRTKSHCLMAASVAVVFVGCLSTMKTDRYAQITASAGLLSFGESRII